MATPLDVKKLQSRLKVTPDGDFGPQTATALFRHFGAKPAIAAALGQGAPAAFRKYGILASGLRLSHFLAQLAHESGDFRYMEEIASGAAYEGRKDLGNVRPGDGKRYKGRGPIQLTGRANYAAFGEALGLDLINHPEMAAQPEIGILIACHYWHTRKLNVPADADDVKTITRKINGGLTNIEDRIAKLVKAKKLIM